jgi:hypothetical protein
MSTSTPSSWPVSAADRTERTKTMFKRLLVATPPALILAALVAAEAYAGSQPQHAQLLGRTLP